MAALKRGQGSVREPVRDQHFAMQLVETRRSAKTTAVDVEVFIPSHRRSWRIVRTYEEFLALNAVLDANLGSDSLRGILPSKATDGWTTGQIQAFLNKLTGIDQTLSTAQYGTAVVASLVRFVSPTCLEVTGAGDRACNGKYIRVLVPRKSKKEKTGATQGAGGAGTGAGAGDSGAVDGGKGKQCCASMTGEKGSGFRVQYEHLGRTLRRAKQGSSSSSSSTIGSGSSSHGGGGIGGGGGNGDEGGGGTEEHTEHCMVLYVIRKVPWQGVLWWVLERSYLPNDRAPAVGVAGAAGAGGEATARETKMGAGVNDGGNLSVIGLKGGDDTALDTRSTDDRTSGTHRAGLHIERLYACRYKAPAVGASPGSPSRAAKPPSSGWQVCRLPGGDSAHPAPRVQTGVTLSDWGSLVDAVAPLPITAAGMSGLPTVAGELQGHLYKEGRIRKSWRRRWFVLEAGGGPLSYYSTPAARTKDRKGRPLQVRVAYSSRLTE